MIYKEYLARFNGSEKKVGVLGEIHLYTTAETAFARQIVPNFDTVAFEGDPQNSIYLTFICMLFTPIVLTLATGAKRSIFNDSSYSIAKEYKKRIIWLEEGTWKSSPLLQKIVFATAGAITIPVSPFAYVYLRYYGDPFTPGTKAYKDMDMAKEKKDKQGLFSRLFRYAYTNDISERNKIMADRSVDILRGSERLLVVCGERHLEGIVENLSSMLSLREVRSVPLS